MERQQREKDWSWPLGASKRKNHCNRKCSAWNPHDKIILNCFNSLLLVERRCVGGRTPVRVRQFYVTNIELQMHLSGTNPVFYWRSQLCFAYLIFTFSNKISDSSVLQFYHFIIALLHVAVVGQCLLWHRKILRSFQFFAFLFFLFPSSVGFHRVCQMATH